MLFRKKRKRQEHKRKRAAARAKPLNATQREWAMTRNFLYYDGTEMPPIHTYKEEQDE